MGGPPVDELPSLGEFLIFHFVVRLLEPAPGETSGMEFSKISRKAGKKGRIG